MQVQGCPCVLQHPMALQVSSLHFDAEEKTEMHRQVHRVF